jgi:hypothetical protein
MPGTTTAAGGEGGVLCDEIDFPSVTGLRWAREGKWSEGNILYGSQVHEEKVKTEVGAC